MKLKKILLLLTVVNLIFIIVRAWTFYSIWWTGFLLADLIYPFFLVETLASLYLSLKGSVSSQIISLLLFANVFIFLTLFFSVVETITVFKGITELYK